MSGPNDLDHTRAGYTESDLYQQLYPNGYQDGHAQYVQSAVCKLLEKHFAAYREELETRAYLRGCREAEEKARDIAHLTAPAPAQAREEALALVGQLGSIAYKSNMHTPSGYAEMLKEMEAALRSRQSPQAIEHTMGDGRTANQFINDAYEDAAPQPSPQGEDAGLKEAVELIRAFIDETQVEGAQENHKQRALGRLIVIEDYANKLRARLAATEREHTYAAQCAREKIQELEARLAASAKDDGEMREPKKSVPQSLVDYCINLAVSYKEGDIELDEAQDFIRGAIKEIL